MVIKPLEFGVSLPWNSHERSCLSLRGLLSGLGKCSVSPGRA